jgi:hypothetical protein
MPVILIQQPQPLIPHLDFAVGRKKRRSDWTSAGARRQVEPNRLAIPFIQKT